jgi:hypothetical protein
MFMPDKSDSKALTPPSDRQEIDRFLQAVATAPQPSPQGRGRLIFAMDATASRQPTWDRACHLQGEMFTQTKGLGSLDIQLCFYRGYDELRVSPWHDNAKDLLKAMSAVQCLGGHTQIARVLSHSIREHKRNTVKALVFIGDSLEEPVDELCHLAGELALLGVPIFVFQEGQDTNACRGFKQLAKLSRGAYCPFDMASPHQLGELLAAVAVFATGGYKALKDFSQRGSDSLKRLTNQMEKP